MTIEEFIQECKKEFDPEKYIVSKLPDIRLYEKSSGICLCPLTFLAYVKYHRYHTVGETELAMEDLDIDTNLGNAIMFLADDEKADYKFLRDDFEVRRAELLAAFSPEAP